MKLFPEKYKEHVSRIHIIALAIAAIFLLICVTWMFVIVILGYDAFPKDIRLFFGRMLVVTLPTSIITITLVIYSISRRFHKEQSETYRKNSLENTDRADLLKSFEHVKYYYPFRARQTFLILLIISGFFTVLALIYRAFSPFGVIAIFFTLTYGPIWFSYRIKKNDYVLLTAEGFSYRSLSETGLLPWNTINEIRLTKQGYLIQGEGRRLIIRVEIEPASAPQPTFIQGLLSNYRHTKELIEHIQQLAPHAYYRQSFLHRDIFAKD